MLSGNTPASSSGKAIAEKDALADDDPATPEAPDLLPLDKLGAVLQLVPLYISTALVSLPKGAPEASP
ncbi:MAG: hypothetical protein ACPH3H_12170, partial [Pseudomonadales bacterium]